MNTSQIADLIFDLHRDFINPKVIARRQVLRLVDRLLTKAAPDILLNRQVDNKENTIEVQNSAIEGTPARPFQHPSSELDKLPERKNLGLDLNRNNADSKSKNDDDDSSAAMPPSGRSGQLLDQAPESERSDAFSIPISEGDPSSAR